MVAFCADYRVRKVHNVTPDKCVMDAKSAIRFIRENSLDLCIDPERILASGGSAGGHLASSLALLPLFNDPSDNARISCIPNALILFNPVLDTSNFKRLGKNSINLSPYHHIKKNAPDTLILHGTKDKIVHHDQSVKFRKKMDEFKNRCELELYKDMPHSFFNSEKYKETLRRAEKFIRSLNWID